MRNWIIASAAGVAAIAAVSTSGLWAPDLRRDAVPLAIANASSEAGAIIDFETAPDPAAAGSVVLDTQHVENFGVAFGPGVTRQRCPSDLCPYDRAASGQFAAFFDGTSTKRLQLTFKRPVIELAMRINLTGGYIGDPFDVEMIGFDANGQRVAASEVDATWSKDAFAWPTTARLSSAQAAITTVSVELRQASRRGAVGFLFDDLVIQYAASDLSGASATK